MQDQDQENLRNRNKYFSSRNQDKNQGLQQIGSQDETNGAGSQEQMIVNNQNANASKMKNGQRKNQSHLMRNKRDYNQYLDDEPKDSQEDEVDLDLPSADQNSDENKQDNGLPTYRDLENEEDDYIGEDSKIADRSDVKATFTRSNVSSLQDYANRPGMTPDTPRIQQRNIVFKNKSSSKQKNQDNTDQSEESEEDINYRKQQQRDEMKFESIQMPSLRSKGGQLQRPVQDEDINDPHASLIKNQKINDTINEDEEGIDVGVSSSRSQSIERSPVGFQYEKRNDIQSARSDQTIRLTQEEINKLRINFDAIDVNGDGTLSKEELRQMLKKLLGNNFNDEGLEEFIDAADENGDGNIDFEEFLKFNKKQVDHNHVYICLEPEKHQGKPINMRPINDSNTGVPKQAKDIQQHLFDYFVRNTHIREISLEDQSDFERKDKSENEGLIEDIRNVHICSDHQRAYVWSITQTKSLSDNLQSQEKRNLWLKVYSLTSAWSSPQTKGNNNNFLRCKINQLREDIKRLESDYKKQSHIIMPEKKSSPGKYQNNEIQGMIEKVRKEQLQRFNILKAKRIYLKQLENELYEKQSKQEMNDFDADIEGQYYHLVKDYEIKQEGNQQSNWLSQKADFSILIGQFDPPKNVYQHDQIQSFYKQFVSSEQGLYFFKYENQEDKDIHLSRLNPQISSDGSGQSSLQNTKPESEIPLGYSVNSLNQPVLFQIGAHSNNCDRVLLEGQPIKLPVDANTNQFAIIRSIDSSKSRQMSFLDNFMVAIMKEIHIKSDNDISNYNHQLKGKNKNQPKKQDYSLIEVVVEIYQTNMEQPMLGANVDMREVNPKPKIEGQEEQNVRNEDFNFCCWYMIDKQNFNMNFTLLIQNLLINMRTPFDLDPQIVSGKEIQKRVVVARNQSSNLRVTEPLNTIGVQICQQMPIFSVELNEGINFTKLEGFQAGSKATRDRWEYQLSSQKKHKIAQENLRQATLIPFLGDHQAELQNLIENQQSTVNNLNFTCKNLYIIIDEAESQKQFIVVHPILPDYFWNSLEGENLKQEIRNQLSQMNGGGNIELQNNPIQTNPYHSGRLGEVPQISKRRIINQENQQKYLAKDGICQSVDHHQIYFQESQGTTDRTYLENNRFGRTNKAKKQIQEIISIKNLEKDHRTTIINEETLKTQKSPRLSPEKLNRQLNRRIKQNSQVNVRSESKLLFEKLVMSQDQSSFIHVAKYKLKRQEDEDGKVAIPMFKYQINIGTLALGQLQQMIYPHEESSPIRQSSQILSQFCYFDEQDGPLQNPYDPNQSLLMINTHIQQQVKVAKQYGEDEEQYQREVSKLKLLQVNLKNQLSKTNEGGVSDKLTKLKNIPISNTFKNFHKSPEVRQQYFLDSLLEANYLNKVTWLRNDQDKQSISDYIAEQSKVKIWMKDGTIKNINIFKEIFKSFPNWAPKLKNLFDCSLSNVEPIGWQIIKNLFVEKMNLVTIKQQQQDPRNVILALKPLRGKPLKLEPGVPASRISTVIHLVGRLNEQYEQFEYLYVLRQHSGMFSTQEKLQKNFNNALQTHEYTNFTNEFVNQTLKQDPKDEDYCQIFSKLYTNASLMSFDTSIGESLGKNKELLALKCWSPYNSIKLIVFDFILKELTEIYEIPLPKVKFDKIVDIQLVRISDQKIQYVVYLDMNETKEIYEIEFEVLETLVQKNEENIQRRFQAVSDFGTQKKIYNSSLIGKYELFSPNLQSSLQNINEYRQQYIINNQVKIIPQYQNFRSNIERNRPKRDGFSLLIDQIRLDFDQKFLYNTSSKQQAITHSFQNQSSIFQFEKRTSKKIKSNIHPENQRDFDYYEFQIAKVTFNNEILESKIFSESQKLKLLDYFVDVVQKQEHAKYYNLFKQTDEWGQHELREEDVRHLLAPRQEFYGSNLLNFNWDNTQLVGNVLARLTDQGDDDFSMFAKIFDHHQRRFMELDMNLMSPISWSLHNNQLKTAKLYLNFLNQITKNSRPEQAQEYSTIFQSFITQLITCDIQNLNDFLNQKDQNNVSQLFCKALDDANLPLFSNDQNTQIFEYPYNINQIGLNVGQMSKDKSINCSIEVEYYLIDLDWIQILNIYDQRPPKHIIQKHLNDNFTTCYNSTLELYQRKRNKPLLLDTVANCNQNELYSYSSIKILIDSQWTKYAYDFYNVQVKLYVIFFIIPFMGDLYMMDEIQTEFSSLHKFFNAIGIISQMVFNLKEALQVVRGVKIIQMLREPSLLVQMINMPLYLIMNLIIFANSAENKSLGSINAIRVMYSLVTIFSFFRLLFLLKIYEGMGFILYSTYEIIFDIKNYIFLAIISNIFFGCLFMIFDTNIGSEYDKLWGPVKWVVYALRNGLHDYQFSDIGFVPELAVTAKGIDLSQGNGIIMSLIWITWILNIITITILLFNLIISIIGHSYDKQLFEYQIILYKQRTKLSIEAREQMKILGIYDENNQLPIIVCQKKDKLQNLKYHESSSRNSQNNMFEQFSSMKEHFEHFKSVEQRQNQKIMQQMNNQLQTISAKYDNLNQQIQLNQGKQRNEMVMKNAFEMSDVITYNANMNNVSH